MVYAKTNTCGTPRTRVNVKYERDQAEFFFLVGGGGGQGAPDHHKTGRSPHNKIFFLHPNLKRVTTEIIVYNTD